MPVKSVPCVNLNPAADLKKHISALSVFVFWLRYVMSIKELMVPFLLYDFLCQ